VSLPPDIGAQQILGRLRSYLTFYISLSLPFIYLSIIYRSIYLSMYAWIVFSSSSSTFQVLSSASGAFGQLLGVLERTQQSAVQAACLAAGQGGATYPAGDDDNTLTSKKHLTPPTTTTGNGPQQLTLARRHHCNEKGGMSRRRTAPTDVAHHWPHRPFDSGQRRCPR